MTDKISLKERVFDLSLGSRMNPITASDREIIESPIEMGQDEICSYELFVPTSWGNPLTNPSIIPADIISSGPVINGRKILFTVDAKNNIKASEDCRINIKFSVNGNELMAWGIWQCKE